MTREQFVAIVWSRLAPHLLYPEDAQFIQDRLAGQEYFDVGWTIDDTVKYHMLMECFTTADEYECCKKMDEIARKYKNTRNS